jgi:hypothetical protein
MDALSINTRLYSIGKIKVIGDNNKTQIHIEPD